jgi:TFIIF-interacting CTD phosphatase-like protein
MKKINILLDLDNTLISSLASDEEKKSHLLKMKKFRWEDMESEYKVFERPGLQPFLDYLFQNFNVSVWTAASKSYCLFIVDKYLVKDHPERRLDYTLFSRHCRRSKKITSYQKSLSILAPNFGLKNYDMDSTWIIDDNPEVYNAQPTNCIKIKAFHFTSRGSSRDAELQNRIKPRLEKILRDENLRIK